MQIKNLNQLLKESLIETINLAFSDYEFPITLNEESFAQFTKSRSVDLEKSIGYFLNDTLVGFILVGFRTFASKKYYYDAATAVIPSHRNKKIGSFLLEHLIAAVKNENSTFSLEVLENNKNAHNLYLKAGFKVSRKFCCYTIEKSKILKPNNSNDYTIKRLNKQQFIDLNTADFDSFIPSWQNSKISILNDWENYKVLTIGKDGEIYGYGAINWDKGDIAQLSLLFQNREIFALNTLLFELAKFSNKEKLTTLNIEEGTYLNSLLIKMGWKNFVNQIEMKL
jgi:ribosomal protein S18 acetylase RimI-like enzyme